MTDNRLISADLLKWFALITMFIDHIGAGIIEKCFLARPGMYLLDRVIRTIGRPSFPIYCFLLIEGYKYTRSRYKYSLNLLIFALISEIPFDYLFRQRMTLNYQNVYFTLLLGFLAIWVGGLLEMKVNVAGMTEFLQILVAAPFAILAHYLRTDYGAWGVMLIATLFIVRNQPRVILCIVGTIYMLTDSSEYAGIIAFILILFYNGKRSGKINKYIFYSMYPLHLALYVGVRYLLTM